MRAFPFFFVFILVSIFIYRNFMSNKEKKLTLVSLREVALAFIVSIVLAMCTTLLNYNWRL